MTKTSLSNSTVRTVLKALSYRTLSLLTTAGVGYVMTGSVKAALSFGLVDAVFKIGVYAAHEKAWEKVLAAAKDEAEAAAAVAAPAAA